MHASKKYMPFTCVCGLAKKLCPDWAGGAPPTPLGKPLPLPLPWWIWWCAWPWKKPFSVEAGRSARLAEPTDSWLWNCAMAWKGSWLFDWFHCKKEDKSGKLSALPPGLGPLKLNWDCLLYVLVPLLLRLKESFSLELTKIHELHIIQTNKRRVFNFMMK